MSFAEAIVSIVHNKALEAIRRHQTAFTIYEKEFTLEPVTQNEWAVFDGPTAIYHVML